MLKKDMNYNKKTEERRGCLNTGYHKRVHLFRNFLVVLPPAPYTKFKLGKKTLETSVQRCSWNERRAFSFVTLMIGVRGSVGGGGGGGCWDAPIILPFWPCNPARGF